MLSREFMKGQLDDAAQKLKHAATGKRDSSQSVQDASENLESTIWDFKRKNLRMLAVDVGEDDG